MHIIAPNYTQIPNVVFDYWMNVLSHVEFKILLAICRKTFGWHKERDSLSIKQIMQMTGINGRSTVCNALKKLEDEGLIKKTKTKTDLGDDAPNKYEIDVRLLEGGSPTVGLRSPTDEGGVVLNSDQGVVLELDTQKKVLSQKKKNIYLDFVQLSEEEHSKLLEEHGKDKLDIMLTKLNSYIGSSGKKYKSHYHCLSKGGWVYQAVEKEQTVPKPKNSQDNRVWAEQTIKGYTNPYCRVDFLSKAVEFTPTTGNDQHVILISYEEKGFKEQFQNALYTKKFKKL